MGLLHWNWGNPVIAPVPVKQPWRIWVKQIITQPQQHIKGQTVYNTILNIIFTP